MNTRTPEQRQQDRSAAVARNPAKAKRDTGSQRRITPVSRPSVVRKHGSDNKT